MTKSEKGTKRLASLVLKALLNARCDCGAEGGGVVWFGEVQALG